MTDRTPRRTPARGLTALAAGLALATLTACGQQAASGPASSQQPSTQAPVAQGGTPTAQPTVTVTATATATATHDGTPGAGSTGAPSASASRAGATDAAGEWVDAKPSSTVVWMSTQPYENAVVFGC